MKVRVKKTPDGLLKAIELLKRKISKEGCMNTLRIRNGFPKPSQFKRVKAYKAEKRLRDQAARKAKQKMYLANRR